MEQAMSPLRSYGSKSQWAWTPDRAIALNNDLASEKNR